MANYPNITNATKTWQQATALYEHTNWFSTGATLLVSTSTVSPEVSGDAGILLPPGESFFVPAGATPWYKLVAEGSSGVISRQSNSIGIPAYDVSDDALKISSIQRKVRESFAYGLTAWDTYTERGGALSTSGGVLTFTSGTTAGAYAEILSKETFTVPMRLMVGVATNRQFNNHCFIEVVSVDPVTGLPDGKNMVAWDIGGQYGGGQVSARYEVQNDGLTPFISANSLIVSTATTSVLELELFPDEVYLHSRAVDTVAARTNSYVKQLQVPDPNALYKVRLRTMNYSNWLTITNAVAGAGNLVRLTAAAHGLSTGAVVWVSNLPGVLNNGSRTVGSFIATVIDVNTLDLQGTSFGGTYQAGSGRLVPAAAPSTAPSFNCSFISINDYAEITAEITAGRGNSVAGQAIAVNVPDIVSTKNVDNVAHNETQTALAANATFTGTSRDTGAAALAFSRYAKFNAMAFADQAGTLRIEVSNDGTTWRRSTPDTAVAANGSAVLTVPVMTRYHRAVFVNGATAQTAFLVNSSFTVA